MNARRAVLIGLQVALVVGYSAATLTFAGQSRDFIIARNNGRAETAARATHAALPATYVFGANQPANALLGAGWWKRDEPAEGVWSRRRAWLYVSVAAGSGDLLLTITAEPFAPPGHPGGAIELWVDGERMPSLRTTLPARLAADGLVELRLEAPGAAVPEHYGLGDDDRELGVLLSSVIVEPATD